MAKSDNNYSRRSSAQKRTNASKNTRNYRLSQKTPSSYSLRGSSAPKRRSSSYSSRNSGNANKLRSSSALKSSGVLKSSNSLKRGTQKTASRAPRNKKTGLQSNTIKLNHNSQIFAKGRLGNSAVKTKMDSEEKKRRLIIILIIVGVVLCLWIMLDLILNIGKIHNGVSVQGVYVGGMTVEQATTAIDEKLNPVVNQSNVVMYASKKAADEDGRTDLKVYCEKDDKSKIDSMPSSSSTEKWTLTQSGLGTTVNASHMANEAYKVGRQGFFLIIDRMLATFGLKNLKADLSFSTDLHKEFVNTVNEKCGTQLVENGFKLDSSGSISSVKGQDGWMLNEDVFSENLRDAIFSDGKIDSFIGPMHTVKIHIGEDTADRVLKEVDTALNQPITITYKSNKWQLDRAALASLISSKVLEPYQVLDFGNGTETVETKGHTSGTVYDASTGLDSSTKYTLQPYISQEAANKYLVSILGEQASTGVKDASFQSDGTKIWINESSTGTGPDRNAATLSMQNIMFGNGESNRTIQLNDITMYPSFSTEQAQALGIKDKLGSFSVTLGGSSSRMNNISLLCKMINNQIIYPGQTWSFNQTTGERTEEKGFQTAPVIVSGKHEDQLGGGVCQVATAVFNAACYSGFGIASRANHDFYIKAYDDYGFCDATVSWEVPDLRFVNDYENPVVMLATFDGNETVTVSMWGTSDGRTVKCERGEWKEGNKYQKIRQNDDSLPAGTEKIVQQGVDGRSIEVHYLATAANGKVLHDVKFKSVYSAQNEITAVGTGSK